MPWLLLVVLLPLVAGVAALFAQGRAMRVLHWVAVPAIVAASAMLALEVLEAGPLRYAMGGWGAPLGIDLYVDGAAALLVLLTGLVAGAGAIYARHYPGPLEPAGRTGRPVFWGLWYLLWASLNALFLAADIFNLYVAMELVTLAAVILVAQTGERQALFAAMRYLLVALVGSLLYLLGVALLYGATGALDFGQLGAALEPGATTRVAAVLVTLGLLLKMALFPFHFWLAPAHSTAVAPVSAVLSGLVVKAWFYLQVRFWLGPFAPLGEEALFALLGALGAGAVLWGSLQALRAPRLKLVIAYSTVAQIGYLFLLFPLMAAAPTQAWTGAFFHVLAHGTAKAAVFLAAGNILYALGHDRVGGIAGLGRRLPMSVMAFGLAGVGLVGLPPSGGFVSKWLLLEGSILGGQWIWVAVLALGGLAAGAYVFRILSIAMTAPEAEAEDLRPVPRSLERAALALALVSMGLGLAPALPIELLTAGAPFPLFQELERLQSQGFWLPVAILASSLVCGVAIFMLRETQARLRTTLNLASALLKLVLVGVLLAGVYAGATYEARLAFLPGLDLVLRADPLTLQFLALSAGLWLVTTIYAIGYLRGSPNRSRFFGFFALSVTASTGIAMSGNLLTFLVFYEFLTLATWPLVVHTATPASCAAGRKYLAYTLAGGVAVLLGTVWLHVAGGNLEFSAANSLAALNAEQPFAVAAIFALLIGGLGVKAALVPLHGWLPSAMVAPAPVSALLHAVAVVKVGAFGIIRVLYDVFGIGFSHVYAGTAVLAMLAAFTIVYGSMRALAQDEIKKRLAYSTVSQLSYIALGAALASPLATVGALVHIVHQGLMKITLFFCAGNLAERYGIHRVQDMDGIGRRMPWTMTAFTVAALGMIGLPPIAGFVSKWYLAAGGIDAGAQWVLPVLLASSALNAMYFLPLVHRAWFRPEARAPVAKRELDGWLVSPPVVTAVLALGAGLLAGWALSPLGWAQLISERTYYGSVPET